MPLLSRSRRTATDTNDDDDTIARSPSPERRPRRGLFSSRRASSTSSEHSNTHSNTGSNWTNRSGSGLFGSRRNKRSIDNDPSIINARQKVSNAEQAEKEADRALMEARRHVQLARDNVRTLEQEAIEEGRMAKLKQAEAKVINRTAKSLGRHGP